MLKHPLLLLALLLAAGCVTPPSDDEIKPLTDQQAQQIYKGQKGPELFGLTVYDSKTGPVFAGAQRVHYGQASELPFVSIADSTAPLVVMNPAGPGDITALIDTSSRYNWLTIPASAAMHVTPLGPKPYALKAGHVHDEYGGFLTVASRAKFNEMEFETVLFYTRAAYGPLGNLARAENSPRPVAVVGNSLLRACSMVQFDFPNRTIGLAASLPYTPASAQLITTIPLRDAQGALACDGIVDDAPATIILDTAGDYEFAMMDPPEGEIRQVSIGDLVFRQVKVENAYERGLGLEKYPRIGRQLLARFKITFDFKKKLIHIEKPDA